MKILGQIEFNGKPLLVVENGVGAFVNGVYTRLLLVPPNVVDREIQDKAEIVNDDQTNQ